MGKGEKKGNLVRVGWRGSAVEGKRIKRAGMVGWKQGGTGRGAVESDWWHGDMCRRKYGKGNTKMKRNEIGQCCRESRGSGRGELERERNGRERVNKVMWEEAGN